MLELAVTIPLFLMLLLGMLEYGYYFYVATGATTAAREGARQCTLVSLGKCGACNPSASVSYMYQLGLSAHTRATADCTAGSNGIMYSVNVTVDYPTLTGFGPVLGLMPTSGIAGNVVAYGSATMRGQ